MAVESTGGRRLRAGADVTRTTRSPWKFVDLGAGLVTGGAFLCSAIVHLGNPYYFLSTIYNYDVVPPAFVESLAIVFPVLELVLAVCLLGRICAGGAHLLTAILIAAYIIPQLVVLARERSIDCGCFGSGDTVSAATVGRAAALLAASLLGYFGFLRANARRPGVLWDDRLGTDGR